jgi:phosphoglucomutase
MTASAGGPPIRFGTSGWRGILAEDFSFPRLRRALHGIGRFFAEGGGGEVLVAHDTRFLAERMAGLAARILLAHGLDARLARGATPTPAVTRGVRRRRAAGAVVLTASHNPPEYQGLKVFGASGGCIDDATARRIERCIAHATEDAPGARREPRAVELRAAYLRDLARRLDRGALSRSRLRVVYDAMHGAGAGVLDAALGEAGVAVRVLRGEPDPHFGGGAPDPAPEALEGLRRELAGLRGRRLGLATDGDADRFAALDSDGRLLSATESLALLVDHLARTGRARSGVAISVATGSLVERVADAHGLPVRRLPIGFKHLSRALVAGDADVAGEESGGFAWAGFGVDKDGILGACLLAELAAGDPRPLRRRVDDLRRCHGGGVCGRAALPAAAGARDRLEALRRSPPGRVDGAVVREARSEEGLHLCLDDGFVMLRLSGTEPVLRVYAEAPGPRPLQRRLRAGLALLRPAGASRESR